MILADEEKKDFLKTKFHQYFDITLSDISIEEKNIEQFVNFVLPLETLNQEYDMDRFKKYLNDEYNNVIFTSADDPEVIYDYEFYQGVYFIRLKPFSINIRMHIIPKKYDASSTATHPILFFKDNKQTIDENNFECTNKYERLEDTHPINLHYKENVEAPSNGMYKFDIKEHTRNIKKLQINLGYSYIEPTDSINKIWHLTGIIDESDNHGNPIPQEEFTEWNESLMDGNCDNNSNFTNKILQQKLVSNQIDWDDIYQHEGGFDNPHELGTLYHKTLKYFNDDLYIEENGLYHLVDWIEIKEE